MAKQKGLGRGLGAIFGNETIDIKVKPMVSPFPSFDYIFYPYDE